MPLFVRFQLESLYGRPVRPKEQAGRHSGAPASQKTEELWEDRLTLSDNQLSNGQNKLSWAVVDKRLDELHKRSPNASHWQLQINVGSSLFPASWKAAGAKTLKYIHKSRGSVEMLLRDRG